ncbi:MAG: hypothetical protein V4722_06900 [Bacteroidota bacterium]
MSDFHSDIQFRIHVDGCIFLIYPIELEGSIFYKVYDDSKHLCDIAPDGKDGFQITEQTRSRAADVAASLIRDIGRAIIDHNGAAGI